MNRSGRPVVRSSGRRRCRIEWAGVVVPQRTRAVAGRAVEAALERDGIADRSLCVKIVDDSECITLHDAHFGDATTTDVMSFPDGADDPESKRVRLGDLAVCLDEARRVAVARKRPVADEITLYVLHGCLHLLGYDDVDPADRAAMWQVQREIMTGLGIDIGKLAP